VTPQNAANLYVHGPSITFGATPLALQQEFAASPGGLYFLFLLFSLSLISISYCFAMQWLSRTPPLCCTKSWKSLLKDWYDVLTNVSFCCLMPPEMAIVLLCVYAYLFALPFLLLVQLIVRVWSQRMRRWNAIGIVIMVDMCALWLLCWLND